MVERVEDRLTDVEDIGGKDADFMRIARERYERAVDHDQDNRDHGLDALSRICDEEVLAVAKAPLTIDMSKVNPFAGRRGTVGSWMGA